MITEGTQIVGRTKELTEVRQSLSRGRVVAIVGPGGIGKTTLARHVAASEAQAFPGGVHFIEGYEIGTGPQDAIESVRDQIRNRSLHDPTLLVIDGLDEFPSL